jgi:hypothetical protein
MYENKIHIDQQIIRNKYIAAFHLMCASPYWGVLKIFIPLANWTSKCRHIPPLESGRCCSKNKGATDLASRKLPILTLPSP